MSWGRLLFASCWAVALGLFLGSAPVSAREPVRWMPGDSIRAAELPPEAIDVLLRIHRGGPFRYGKDGSVFGNREGLLPRRPRGYYTEYTVTTPGARDRGARRIVAGGNPRVTQELYYTRDHYRSFQRIREWPQ
ncbi:MAG: ribonuclease domain-containing protein [Burkholderiaceae bacterium]